MNSQTRLMWFRRLALAGALLAAAVVVLGAWVRLTDAGLGCPDWPGCYGHIYPNAGQTPGYAAADNAAAGGMTSRSATAAAAVAPRMHFGKALHEMIHRYFAGSLVL